MGPIISFIVIYLLGGLTFIPLLLSLLALHAYMTLPPASTSAEDEPAAVQRKDDHKLVLKTGTDELEEQFRRSHVTDVASGYFAVCREYVPGGVNGKPPEKLSPAGEAIALESPSVYQSMYRSIFDRQQKPTIEPNRDSAGKSMKKTNNVFFVVLRHGQIVLYDDVQQIQVRHVISLEHHDVDLYGGGENIPEGELWIKRNAIRLKLKASVTSLGNKPTSRLPFFLFSENNSDKEDFYFAILRNQSKLNLSDSPPDPQNFEVGHIVTLVQRLHSSEEHLQTRWLNAMVGRMFLAMYRTPEFEAAVRSKLAKKISRVKKPAFITKLSLLKINLGEGAPFLTNPRLKDLTVNGDCTAEADFDYSGKFRIEIGATARIDLGSRFKAREVELVLVAKCNRVEGHVLLRFKPPPSTRLWFTFEGMPRIDLTIEPIVSSRQVTYSVIVNAIQSRIREVVAESIVLPFWDDLAFFDTSNESFRGGIWRKDRIFTGPTEIQSEEAEDDAETGGEASSTASDERSMSTPALVSPKEGLKSRLTRKPTTQPTDIVGYASSSAIDKAIKPEAPRLIRSTSIASAADPMLTPSHADGDAARRETDATPMRDQASSLLQDLSSKSLTTSPAESPIGSLPDEPATPVMVKERSLSTGSKTPEENSTATPGRLKSKVSWTLRSASNTSMLKSSTPATSDDSEPRQGKSFAKSLTTGDRKQAIASLNAATTAAQKWGLGVLHRTKQKDNQGIGEEPSDSSSPVAIGHHHPLPPPDIPSPPPERSNVKALFNVPKRKPLPPPFLPKRSPGSFAGDDGTSESQRQPPPLPTRVREQISIPNMDGQVDEESEAEVPTKPASATHLADEHHDDFFGHGEGGVSTDLSSDISTNLEDLTGAKFPGSDDMMASQEEVAVVPGQDLLHPSSPS